MHYGKLPRKEFVRKKKAVLAFEHVGKGALLPKRYFAYFIILKHNPESWLWGFKNAVVKTLGTIAEFFGQL